MRTIWNKIGHTFDAMSPARLISIGFAAVILIGAILLKLPCAVNEGVHISLLDAFFTATSAVCVTGLITVDTGDTFNVFGRTVIALLIQVGGLGVASVGAGIVMATGRKMGFKSRFIVKEAMNVNNFKGLIHLVKYVLMTTLIIEAAGAILSFFVFVQHYEWPAALGISVFHSIAAFNNGGFDILGGMQNLIPYQDNIFLNVVTAVLITLGGIGFLVILDVIKTRKFKKFYLHTKLVLTTSAVLLVVGTLLLKLTEDISWLGAFFQSVSARTAGFSTYPMGEFTDAGLFVMIILMFIGASSGSTGGGIKTTTFVIMMAAAVSMATNQHCVAFKRKIPKDIIYRAFIISTLGLTVVFIGTFGLLLLEPGYSFIQILFEVVSAFATVGLSTGITPLFGAGGKLLLILIMFTGRIGVLTAISIWAFKEPSRAEFTEEEVTVG